MDSGDDRSQGAPGESPRSGGTPPRPAKRGCWPVVPRYLHQLEAEEIERFIDSMLREVLAKHPDLCDTVGRCAREKGDRATGPAESLPHRSSVLLRVFARRGAASRLCSPLRIHSGVPYPRRRLFTAGSDRDATLRRLCEDIVFSLARNKYGGKKGVELTITYQLMVRALPPSLPRAVRTTGVVARLRVSYPFGLRCL